MIKSKCKIYLNDNQLSITAESVPDSLIHIKLLLIFLNEKRCFTFILIVLIAQFLTDVQLEINIMLICSILSCQFKVSYFYERY